MLGRDESRKRMSLNADVAITQCAAETISPFARRFVAVDKARRAQSTGLRTYIVGHGEVALIDPDWTSGPLMEAILEATEGELITHVLITHDHGRRASIGAQLAERFGADVVSGATGLRDGERIYGLDWTLEAIKTPGHTPDHFAFALAEEQTVFCGDLVTGWSPEIVTPPGGDLSALLASLRRIHQDQFEMLAPARGPLVRNAAAFLSDCLVDVARREARVAAMVGEHGPASAWRLAQHMSPTPHGFGAAEAHAILAHLVRLMARGDVTSTAPLSLFAPFTSKSDSPGRAGVERSARATGVSARRETLDRYPAGISDLSAAAG
jgi:glyoxylase-like metal-dependent hydrolase (beta-lactamase superfamily II)